MWAFLFLLLSPLTYSYETPKITLYMTVDWEGRAVDSKNLETMRAFRDKYPQIPMLHFLNPAYYTKDGASASSITNQVRSVFSPLDEHGLHIHAWKSLIEKCGLIYQTRPSFADRNEDCEGECGHTVSLEYAYSQEQLTQLVGCGSEILVQKGFKRPKSFRAGGWQLGPKLAQALQANGFTFDSSRTDASILVSSWGEGSALVKMVRGLHPGASILDQPYQLLPGLMEYPDNASLADYTPPETLIRIFKELMKNGKRTMVLGFHQETASKFLRNLEQAIPVMEEEARKAGVVLEWAHFSQ
jgi:hypothetical protein